MTKNRHFIFTELSADSLTAGKFFDGLTVVDTVDMNGRPVSVNAGELATYLRNTLAAIAATRGESGELVGLPIDAANHDKGDAAGWIVGIELVGNVLRLLPKWNDIGKELIGKSIRRFFSPTIDTISKTILGGTLTNWIAQTDKAGKVLLRPIELSQSMFELATAPAPASAGVDDAENSLNDKLDDVYSAWNEQYQMPEPMSMDNYCSIVEVFEDHVIVCQDDSLFSVPYTRNPDDSITFAPDTEWTPVKKTYAEAALKFVRSLLNLNKRQASAKSPRNKKGEPMTVKLADLSAEDKAELARLAATHIQATQTPTPAASNATTAPAVDLAQLLGINGMTEAGKKQLTQYIELQTQNMQQQAQLAYQAEMVRIQRENAVTDLAQRVVGGTAETPRGIKGVTAEELKKHLLALPVDESLFFGNLLQAIVKDGFIEFTELGHERPVKGQVELPPEVAAKLDDGTFKIADLSNPILGLGSLADYNLTKWNGTAK